MTEKFGNDFVTTINEPSNIDNSTNPITITLDDTPPAALSSGNWRARIDQEIFLITSVSGNDVTATRAQEGTSMATHLDGAAFHHVLTAESITKIPVYPLLATSNVFQGSLALPIATTAGPTYSIDDSDWLVLANAVNNEITITLPTAVGCSGRQYIIKKFDSTSSTYRVTIDTTGGQNIDSESTQVITDNYTAITVVSNGTNWVIV